MFVDSHCHLDCIKLDEFEDSFEHLIKKTTDAGIDHMLCVSINLDDYPAMLAMVEPYEQISVSVGVHPMSDKDKIPDTAYLKNLASNKKVIAIGETGLDYYYNKNDIDRQQAFFREHINCAIEVNKPVIVHTRDASSDTLNILREQNADRCGGVIHCFTESMQFAEDAMGLGFMISFSGIITFNNADRLREVVKNIPDEFLLIETDSPYLAPKPFRGKQNWPAHVSSVAEKIAELRNTNIEHIAQISKNNFNRLFHTNVQ